MNQVVVAWYGWLSGITQGTVFALQGWAERVELPVFTALVLGVIGAMAPCQLTTSLSALAFASAHAGGARPLGLALAYVAGKVSAYTVIGVAIIVVGLQLQAFSIPVVIVAQSARPPDDRGRSRPARVLAAEARDGAASCSPCP